jgi:hypothetical protein
MFVVRMDDAHEAFVVQDIFQPMYASIWDHHVLPCIAAASASSGTTEDRLQATLNVSSAGSLPDNAEVMLLSFTFSYALNRTCRACFTQTLVLSVEVLGYGEPRLYGSPASQQAGCTAEYRLVTLRLLPSNPQLQGPPVIAYMILFDEQVGSHCAVLDSPRCVLTCCVYLVTVGGAVQPMAGGRPAAGVPTLSARQRRGNVRLRRQAA